jgi:predicted  nucleic acid-binding Zn-ribbon protein
MKEDIFKKMKKFKEDTNKQLNKIGKTVQDMKEEFNKDKEILKKNQTEILEMKSSISQIKASLGNLSSRVE